MRRKSNKFVITFHSTTDAIEMEKICKLQQMPGRLVPVPRSISASCGLCWICEKDKSDKLKQMISSFDLDTEEYYYLYMY